MKRQYLVDGDDGMKYLHLRGKRFLLLGEIKAIEGASANELREIVRIQMAYALYQGIVDSYGQQIH